MNRSFPVVLIGCIDSIAEPSSLNPEQGCRRLITSGASSYDTPYTHISSTYSSASVLAGRAERVAQLIISIGWCV